MISVKSRNAKRRYESPLREEGARRTQQVVVSVARELFVAHGYAATSLADVAAKAGVARPTVFAAFGSKSALLRQVLDQALAGDDEDIPAFKRPWFQPVWNAPSQGTALDAYATVCTLICERAAEIFETVRQAANSAADVTELWNTMQSNRRAGARMVIEHLESFGPLRGGLDTEQATDLLWIFNDPAHYNALVLQCGWSKTSFTDWLSDEMRNALLSR